MVEGDGDVKKVKPAYARIGENQPGAVTLSSVSAMSVVSVSVEWEIRETYDSNDVRKDFGRRNMAVIFKEVKSGWGNVRGRRFPQGGLSSVFWF